MRVWVGMSVTEGPGGVGHPGTVLRHPLRTDAVSGQSLRPGHPVEPGAIVVLTVG